MHRFTLFFLALLIAPFASRSQLSGTTEWETMTTIGTPIPRHENAFVRVDANFYLLGGRGIKPVSIYNSETNTWSEGKAPPLEIHHFQGVAYQGKIYVIGAMTGKYPYETLLANILVYSPKDDSWESGPEIPEERRRGSCGVVIQGDEAYMISGIIDGHNDQHVPWVDSYNFKTKIWKVLEDAPRARDHFQAAVGNGKIYAVGGRNSSYKTKQTFELTIPEVDVYDITTDRWTTLDKTYNLPTERAGASTVLYENHLIVIGGESDSMERAHDEVEAFDLKNMEWKELHSLQRGRHGTQAILHEDHMYTVAGSGNRGGTPELSSLEKIRLTK